MIVRIICLVIGYCFGLFQTSYLIGKQMGIDIRNTGSGNAGTTNALRALGKKAGVITFVCDIMKCILAVFVTWLLFRNSHPDIVKLLGVYASTGVILGHTFPFYLGFKGGKGAAATGGMIIAFLDWRLILIGAILFFGACLITKYVSLGSLLMVTSFLIGVIIRGSMGAYHLSKGPLIELYVLTAIITALVYWLHRGNIVRLLKGEERKTYLVNKKSEE